MSFLNELKRRNVYRVAALYIVVSWLILQVADVLGSVLALPDWTGRMVFLLLAVGFPVALVLAWAFELTPEGLKREREVEPERSSASGNRKNLDLLIIGVLVVALAWFAWQHDWSPSPGGEIRSVVVLPLDNLVNDPEQAYFVAGMHEALITELSKVDALRVISRTSAMRFEDSGKTIPEIAAELDVDAVIEGSVLKAEDTVRITVQLIEASRDQHLWAGKFDRPLQNILALYSDVTREIVDHIEVTLSADERAEITAAPEVDPAVYELYLKGRFHCDNWSPADMERGIRLLQQAVRLDPGNAPAHAQLAICLQYSAFFGYSTPLDIYDQSLASAERSIEIDPDLAEGYVALAGVKYYLDFQPRASLDLLYQALERDPANVRALLHLSWLLGEAGRFKEGLAFNQRALSIDPLSTVVTHAVGQLYYLNRDFEAAIDAYREALELDSGDPSLYFSIAWPLEQLGRFEEAFDLHERSIALSGGASIYRASLGYALGIAGREADALSVLAALESEGAAPYERAIVNLGVGRLDTALELLEDAFEARDSFVIYMNRGPKFDPLRDHPGFQHLLERIDWPPPDAPLPVTRP